MNKRTRAEIFAVLCLVILIFDSKTAISSASEGIDVCLKSVIPSLFPFLTLSIYLTHSFDGSSGMVLKKICKLFRIPSEAGILPICAFLGGYPVGAQSIGILYKDGILHQKDAERLLAYCSHSGPAFIFGIAASLFDERWVPWLIWGIQIISAYFVSIWFGHYIKIEKQMTQNPISIMTAVKNAISIMSLICAWVILFRVILTYMQRWLFLKMPLVAKVVLSGALELTNGCIAVNAIKDANLRFILCSAFLSFGGFCVLVQTASVTNGLSLKYYCIGKTMQTGICICLSWALIYHQWIVLAFFLICLYVFPKIFQKRVELRKEMMYNADIHRRRDHHALSKENR